MNRTTDSSLLFFSRVAVDRADSHMSKKALAIATSALCLLAAACSSDSSADATKTVTETVFSSASAAASDASTAASSAAPSSESAAPAAEESTLLYTVTVDGGPAEVICNDGNNVEQHEQDVTGTWTKSVTYADDDVMQGGYLGANIKGEGTVTCKIEHRGQVVAESSQTGNYAYANCPIEQDLD